MAKGLMVFDALYFWLTGCMTAQLQD